MLCVSQTRVRREAVGKAEGAGAAWVGAPVGLPRQSTAAPAGQIPLVFFAMTCVGFLLISDLRQSTKEEDLDFTTQKLQSIDSTAEE